MQLAHRPGSHTGLLGELAWVREPLLHAHNLLRWLEIVGGLLLLLQLLHANLLLLLQPQLLLLLQLESLLLQVLLLKHGSLLLNLWPSIELARRHRYLRLQKALDATWLLWQWWPRYCLCWRLHLHHATQRCWWDWLGGQLGHGYLVGVLGQQPSQAFRHTSC